MLRKRAWDLMRTEFLQVSAEAPLAQAMAGLLGLTSRQPDNQVVVAVDAQGCLAGVLTLRDMLRIVEEGVLTEEMLQDIDEAEWDRAFVHACTGSCGEPVAEHLNRQPPVASPTDPLLVVIDLLVASGSGFVVVCEGQRPLGLVLASDVFREVGRGMSLA